MDNHDAPRSASVGYVDRRITKIPNWHGLVAWDMLFNNLAAGIFLVAGIGELLRPQEFATLATVAYPLALVFLTADLICLVFDLGDPWRFHHMLRVFKPSSPMSLGTWSLTAYSLPLTILAGLSLLPGDGPMLTWARRLAIVAGLLPALGSAVYKGVLFSTSSQPGWKDARWLGAYMTTSAFLIGSAVLLGLAVVLGPDAAVAMLRVATMPLLLLNGVCLALLGIELKAVFSTAQGRRSLLRTGGVALGLGVLVPLALMLAAIPAMNFVASLLILLAAAVVRFEIVHVPHVAG